RLHPRALRGEDLERGDVEVEVPERSDVFRLVAPHFPRIDAVLGLGYPGSVGVPSPADPAEPVGPHEAKGGRVAGDWPQGNILLGEDDEVVEDELHRPAAMGLVEAEEGAAVVLGHRRMRAGVLTDRPAKGAYRIIFRLPRDVVPPLDACRRIADR